MLYTSSETASSHLRTCTYKNLVHTTNGTTSSELVTDTYKYENTYNLRRVEKALKEWVSSTFFTVQWLRCGIKENKKRKEKWCGYMIQQLIKQNNAQHNILQAKLL